jgi:hypothetical protein
MPAQCSCGAMTVTTAPAGQVVTSIDRLFERLVPLGIGRADLRVRLGVSVAALAIDTIVAGATKVQAQGEISYYVRDGSFYVVTRRGGVLHTDCPAQSVTGLVTADLLNDPALLDDLLLTAVAPLLRRRGFFSVHAFAAAWHGQAALLIGASGSGKSTGGLALVRAGWRFISDDRPLVRQGSSGVDVWGWHDPANIAWSTAILFPELKTAFSAEHEELKASCAIAQVYGDVLADMAPAAVLLFPHVAAQQVSTVTPMSASQALAGLLSQSMDAWDKGVIAAHFELLSSLVESIPAYRLRLGRDVDALPDLVSNLLPGR